MDEVTAIKNKRTPIILSERRDHVKVLAERLSTHTENLIVLTGTASARERRDVIEKLAAVPDHESLVIVATRKYVGEGFDCPRLDTLFLALPIAWRGKVAQYAGRLHRDYSGKNEVQIYDYVDIYVSVLEKMYQKRIKSYASIGYQVKITPSAEHCQYDLIYNGKSYDPAFCNDLKNAKQEILIVSPYIWKKRLMQILKMLSVLLVNQIAVTVVTRPPENFPEREREGAEENINCLKEYGIRIVLKADFHQKFTIIDGKTVWYGSVNFFSFGTVEESIMRFENTQIAGQLIGII